MSDKPALSVVAPCFNEEGVLPEFLARVAAVLDRDGRIVAVRLMRNHGHQLALTAGLSICRGERVLIIDADLQDPPELLPEMLALMDQGADVVYGRRRTREGESL